MNIKRRTILLGIYNLLVSIAFIFTGILMIQSGYGVFAEYPKKWLDVLPFNSWVEPGIIVLVVFGIGNIVASVFAFINSINKAFIISSIIGLLAFTGNLILSLILQETYLATIEICIISAIQIALSGYLFVGYQKESVKG